MTFKEFHQKYSAAGKISLRRSQFRLAESNATMAIWLGKQYLGQREPENDDKDIDAPTRLLAEFAKIMKDQK